MKSVNRLSINLLPAKFRLFGDYLKNRKDVILNFIAAVFWTILGIRAITHLDTSWDSLAYHLPFASRLAGIFPNTGYLFYNTIEQLFLGTPKLAELTQGLLWRLTGLVSAPNLVGLMCILLVAYIASRRLKFRFWIFTLFVFSIPLVVIHSVSSYIDLPANSFIAIAFINFLAAFEKDRFDLRNLIYILIPLAIAANIKYQGLLISAPLFILTLIIYLVKNKHQIVENKKISPFLYRFLIICILCGSLLSWNLVVNYVRFKNPFYPVATKMGPISFDGLWREVPTTESQDIKQVFVIYAKSLSEIGIWTNNHGSLWSIDMSSVGVPKDDPIFKTGGYFVVNLLLWGTFLLLSCWYTKDRKGIYSFLFVLGSFAFVSLLPGSKYLRYWLFLPLDLLIVTLWMYQRNAGKLKQLFDIVLFLQLFVFLFVSYQTSRIIFPRDLNPSGIMQSLNYLENVKQEDYTITNIESPVCIVTGDTRDGFLYKLSNPTLAIQSATEEGQCVLPSSIYP